MSYRTIFQVISILSVSSIYYSCVGAKYSDPAQEENTVGTPTFKQSVPISKLQTLNKIEINQLKNGSSVTKTSPILEICPSCCLDCQYQTLTPPTVIKEFVDSNPCINNVEQQFQAIKQHGSRLGAYASIDYIHRDRYTERIDNTFGLQNHIQGVKRLRVPGYFAVTGGDPSMDVVTTSLSNEAGSFVAGIARFIFEDIFRTKNRGAADLWIIQFDSKFDKAGNTYGTNMDFGPWKWPHPWDTVIVPLELEKGEYWHPGGIEALGDIIAVPIQAYLVNNKTKTVFLYVNDPRNPVRIEYEMPVGGGDVSMLKLPSGYYLIQISGAWYLSNSTNFADGFNMSVTYNQGLNGSQAHIIEQCDGKYYYMGFDNTGSAAPTFSNGNDMAKLYKLDFTGTGLLNNPPTFTKAPTQTFVAEKQLYCYDSDGKFCNFDAAGGVYLDKNTRKLSVYGVHHFRTGAESNPSEMIRMREFAQ